jgi:hypothetical protein
MAKPASSAETRFGRCSDARVADLLNHVPYFEQHRRRLALSDETAHALHAPDDPIGREFAQRPIYGHARDAESRREFTFGWQPSPRAPFARSDALQNELLDPFV